jgi:hypothetical protein
MKTIRIAALLTILLVSPACEFPEVLGRINHVLIVSDGVSVTFHPPTDRDDDDDFDLSDAIGISGILSSLISLF